MPEPTTRKLFTPGLMELRGVLTHVRFHRDGFLIGKLADGSPIKGALRRPEVGVSYAFEGQWVDDARHGRQFAFSSYRPLYPRDVGGIRAYLIQHAAGIGPELSRRLVDRFGVDTLDVCREDPRRVAREVRGLRPALAEQLSKQLRSREAEEEQELALTTLLHGARVSQRVRAELLRRFGARAAEQARTDPYGLIGAVRGVGFTTADAIAQHIGIARDDPQRLRAAVIHTLRARAQSSGDTCVPRPELESAVAELTSVPHARAAVAIEAAIREGVCERAQDLVSLSLFARAEHEIARRLRALAGTRGGAHGFDASGLAPDQARAVARALTEGVFVLTGAPGTGKTYTIRRILDAFPEARIALAAPTGKAAKRITEQTGRPAQTIHRLLEPVFDAGGFRFARNAEHRLEVDLVVLDEVSMIDVLLMARLLEAVPDAARLILVGDMNQLPAVGPGNVLADVIRSERIPWAELDRIKRQDEGWIVRNCHRIRRGEPLAIDNAHARDFFVIERAHDTQIRDLVIELMCERLPARYGTDPLRDQQVLVPLRARTELSCDALNERLQRRLNPAVSIDSHRIAAGDKVIQTRNDYELGLFNGDLGRVERCEDGALQVRFETWDRDIVLDAQRNDLELAYALTVHKFQGSEARIVVIPVHRSAGVRVLQRSWLYTAISRAREVCVIVGQRDELERIVHRDRSRVRSTRLCALLRDAAELERHR